MNDKTDVPPPLRRSRRFGLWMLLSLALLMGLAGLAGLALTGRMIAVPAWALDRVEARLQAAVAPMRLELGGADVLFSRQGVPQVHLSGVALSDGAGRPLAFLPDLNATFAPALRERQMRVVRVALTGAEVTLRRDPQGRFDLALGNAMTPIGASQSLAGIIEQIDGLFALPQLSALKGLSAEALRLRYEDARSGRVWQVENGLLTLDVAQTEIESRLFFSLTNDLGVPSEVAMSVATDRGSAATRMSANFSDVPAADIAAQSPALTFLGIIEAPISGAVRTGITADGGLAPLSAALEIGAGALRPVREAPPIRFTAGKSYFTYDPATDRLSFDEIAVDTDVLRLSADGHAYLRDYVDGWPTSLITQMRFRQVETDPEGMFESPAVFDGGAVDLKLALDPFTATIGQVVLNDAEGVNYRGKGVVRARAEGWQVDLDLMLDEISQSRLLALWPVDLVPRTRQWVTENVLSGKFFDVRAALRLAPDMPPRVLLTHEFRDGTVRFMKTMPPIEGGYGYATLTEKSFTLVMDKGTVHADRGGAIDAAGSVFHVPDITQKPPPAEITLRTRSSLEAVLSLLDRPPLQIMTKAGQPVDLAAAEAEIEASIGLDLAKDVQTEDVTYAVKGKLRNMRSEALVKGRVLAADMLDLRADTSELSITGLATLDGIPVQGSWRQLMGPEHRGKSTVDGTVELSQAFVDTFRIGLPPGSISGRGVGAVRIDLNGTEPPRFQLGSDLNRMGLRLPELGWSKPQNATGSLSVAGTLGAPPVIDTLEFAARGLSASGRVDLSADGTLDAVRFSRVRLGGWLDAPVTLSGRGAGRPPAVAVTGGSVDLRRADLGGGSGQGGPIDLALDRLIVSNGIALTDVRGTLSPQGGLSGKVTGRMAGSGAPLSATLAPAANGTAIRVLSDDAGGVLRGAGVFEKSKGGALDLVLTPRGPKGDYDGTLRITRTRVKGASALAELLSAVSVVGLLEMMDGEGLMFSDVEARFRLTPAALEIKSSSAVGPSLGISLAGLYMMGTNQMDMSGVISPVYLLNGIGAILTRKGEGLFGFNFRMSGDARAPRVSVNPLSILTPGMFREIFRRAPPELAN